VTAFQSLSLTSLPPRPCAPLSSSAKSFLSRHAGNILGGVMLGTGMAISGACPGTVLAQLGAGVPSGRYAFGGAVLAGWAWNVLFSKRMPKASKDKADGDGEGKKKQAETIYEMLNTPYIKAVAAMEVLLAACIALAVKYAPAEAGYTRNVVPPLIGGACMALSQFISLALRRTTLGASTSFEELGSNLWAIVKGQWDQIKSWKNVLFMGGMVAGAKAVTAFVPAAAVSLVEGTAVSPLRGLLGGFLIVFGSRMAGGCTSGHGISGLSLLSVSSFLTVAMTFAAGGVVGLSMG